jgi:hypothetical protein
MLFLHVLCFQKVLETIAPVLMGSWPPYTAYYNSTKFPYSLKGIFGPKRDEMKGELRKLRNEELLDLYSSPSIIRIIKSMGGPCSTNGGKEEHL